MPDTDDDDIIIIRGGRMRVQRTALTTGEASILDAIAAKGDVELSPLETLAVGVIFGRVAERP